jgi:hypothetical protein
MVLLRLHLWEPMWQLLQLRRKPCGFLFAVGRSLPVFARMFFRKIDADRLGRELMVRGLPVARTISALTLSVVAGATTTGLIG